MTPRLPIAPTHALRHRVALLAAALTLACTPRLAAAADCELALSFAATVAGNGQRARASQSDFEARQVGSDARLPAIDAAQQAKACGCPEAIPFLAEAAQDAARVNTAINLTAMQQFGASIRKQGEAAIAALRRCATRPP